MSDTSVVEDRFEQGFRGDPVPDQAEQRGAAELEAAKAAVAARYPALAPHLADAKVQWGDPSIYEKTGGHLEFYPPWESENPNPGKVTLELYDRSLKGKALEDAIAGDMLHHLAAVNPETQQPVDAKWRGMRDEVIAGRDAASKAMDERAYAAATKGGDTRDFDQWMDNSRADAHVRGYLTPDKDDNWRNAYTPQQKATLDQMRNYLTAAPALPVSPPAIAGPGLVNGGTAP